MPLILWISIWMLPQSRQVQSFIRPLFHMIWYSLRLMHLEVMRKFRSWLWDSIFTTEILLGHWLIFLSKIVDFSFAVQKLAKFSSNTGKVHFEGLVHLLRYIRDNKTLGLKYYAYMTDAPLSDLLRKSNINTKNHMVAFHDSSCKDFPDTGIITRAYIIFYQGRPIDHFTHVPGPVSQSSSKSEYNATCTAVMAVAHFRMLIDELLNKDPYIVP